MSFKYFDRIKEVSSTSGTGDITLSGAPQGFASFSSVYNDGDTMYYTITDQSGADWEVGHGIYNSGPNTLTRSSVTASSNAGGLVNFISGALFVFTTIAAAQLVGTASSTNGTGNVVLTNSAALTGGVSITSTSASDKILINSNAGADIEINPTGSGVLYLANLTTGSVVMQPATRWELSGAGNGQIIPGATLKIAPGLTGIMDNMTIGGITPVNGTFSQLTVTGPATFNASAVVGTTALATSATTGFFWIPSCPGVPTGGPIPPYSLAAGMVWDSVDEQLYVRNGGTWFPVGNATSILYDVTQHGVTPNLGTQQTAAIQTALNGAAAAGRVAYFPGWGAPYCYNNVITIPSTTIGLLGDGYTSELRCLTAGGTNSVWSGASISNFFIKGLRWNSINATGVASPVENDGQLLLTSCTNYEISGCFFYLALGAAILMRSCVSGNVHDNQTINCWHDSFHHTKACNDINTHHNIVVNGGDDAYAVVGYLTDNVAPTNININHNQVRGTKSARGVAVVGGTDIVIAGNQIFNTYAAGIIIGTDGSFGTFPATNVKCYGNIVDGCGNITGLNNLGGVTAQAAVLLAASASQPPAGIDFFDNDIVNSCNIGLNIQSGATNGLLNSRISYNRVNDNTDPYCRNGYSLTANGTSAAAQAVITLNNVTGVGYGMYVTGTNIPDNTTVIAATKTTVTLSQNITGGGISGGATIKFFGVRNGVDIVQPVGFVDSRLFTSGSTASGAVLPFAVVTGVNIDEGVTGTNIASNSIVIAFTATTMTLNQAISGTVASGAAIVFTNLSKAFVQIASSGTSASAQPVLTLANTTGLFIGMQAQSTSGIAQGSTILSISAGVSVTLSANLTGSVTSQTISFSGVSLSGANSSGMEINSSYDLDVTHNILTRTAGSGIFINSTCAGLTRCKDNLFEDTNISNKTAGRCIDLGNGFAATPAVLELKGNRAKQPSQWPKTFDHFITNLNWAQTMWGEDNVAENAFSSIQSSASNASITVSASPFTYTNSNASAVVVNVTGGTVSAIGINVGPGNVATGQTSGSFYLKPTQKLQVTYSVLPTMTEQQMLGQ